MKCKTFALGDVFKITSGGTPTRKNEDFYKDGQIPWVKTGDLKTKYIYKTSENINQLGVENSSAKVFPKKTVLIAMYGATIGNCSLLGIESASNQACAAFLPNDSVIPEYLYYFLISIKDRLISLGVGGAQPNISVSILKQLRIPLPPLETQKKIAAVLDKAQELIDKRKEQLAKLDEFVQSVFLEMFGDPRPKRSNRRTIKLKELGDWKSGGTPSRDNTDYYKGTIPWYSSGDLNQMYIIDRNVEFITEKAIKESSAKMIEPGSLLLGMYDTAALKSSITLCSSSCNQAIAFAKLSTNLCNTVFVYIVIQLARDYYKRLQRGVRQQNMNLSMIKDIEIPLPPLGLQNQFAAIVEKTERQKALMQQSLAEMENNFNSLMQQAFKGELFQ